MAEKRMLTMKICDSDAFLDMPQSTQNLYFHLNLRADDDGFIGNPKRIQKLINASEDDLKLLLLKRFIIAFDSGVIVIKHWRMHNTIQADRYKQTAYQDELNLLMLKPNKSYKLKSELEDKKPMDTKCFQNVSTVLGLGLDLESDLGLDLELDLKKNDSNNQLEELLDIMESEFKRPITSTESEKIIYWFNLVGYKYIEHALRETIINRKTSVAYMEAILKDWTKKEITVEMLNQGIRSR